jgi:hypothetical protein
MPRLALAVAAAIVIHLMPSLTAPAAAAAGDVAKSHDYPGIGRFKGSVITGYDVKDFDAATLQAAPFKDGKATDPRRVEGRILPYRLRRGAWSLDS